MKLIRSSLFIFLIWVLPLAANPIVETYFSELKLNENDPYGWILEFDPQFPPQVGYYLTSSSDTSYFPHDYMSGTFLQITSDSLNKPLAINPTGDVLRLYSNDGYLYDEIVFGTGDTVMVRPPQGDMSISVRDYFEGESQIIYKYLETPPTLGSENRVNFYQGYLTGVVQDEQGQPVSGVAISESECYNSMTHYFNEEGVATDQQGQFTIHKDARFEKLHFSKDGYQSFDIRQQIWPDSTVDLGALTMYLVNALPEKPAAHHPETYQLLQNHPNPFNAQTTITYNLPYSDLVEIAIYDVNGRKLQTLFSGYQQHGWHRINWNAAEQASGLYVYSLQTSETVLYRKCLLIK